MLRTALLCSALLGPAPIQAAPASHIMVDLETGQIFASNEAYTQSYVAHLVQLMTIFVAAQTVAAAGFGYETLVIISPEAAMQDHPTLGLLQGQSLTLGELMAASAALKSNDAAHAISRAVAQDGGDFIARMNATARTLCMPQTRFDNATGQTSPMQQTTAHDLAVLVRAIYQTHPDILTLTIADTVHFAGTERLGTHFGMATRITGLLGLMTAYSFNAGFVGVSVVERNNRQQVIVVLGAQSRSELEERINNLASTSIAPTMPLLPRESSWLSDCETS